MAIWQWGLLLLALVWGFQSLGVWVQMRHYSDVFKGITERYGDGFVGAGHVRGRLRKGTIALLVVDPDLAVRRLLTMSGRSVFAKFSRHHDFEGMSLDALRAMPEIFGKDRPEAVEAVRGAIAQVDRARAQSQGREDSGAAGKTGAPRDVRLSLGATG